MIRYIIRKKSVGHQGKIITDIYIIKNYAFDGHKITANNSALRASSLGDIRMNYAKLTIASNSALRASSSIDI